MCIILNPNYISCPTLMTSMKMMKELEKNEILYKLYMLAIYTLYLNKN